MGDTKSLVSICIPTYNGSEFIQEALDSIVAQTYDHIECIISDDESRDGTLEIVSRFRESVNFPVHILSHKPSGIGANWNNTILHANGNYIKFLFQDDVLEPDCIEKMVEVLDKNPEVGLVASKREFIVSRELDKATQKWFEKYGDLQDQLIAKPCGDIELDQTLFSDKNFMKAPKNKIGEPSAVMFRKELIAQLGVFDEKLKQILDYEYWYRILKEYRIYILRDKLVKFRLHDNQATAVNSKSDIVDYALYPQILYNDYYSLLHPKNKKELFFRYHWLGRVLKTIGNAF